ncbi:MAG: hypothetical protein CSA34_02365 [Desulfobulbus propionicus]|nr:MAG: hypothetical protein CSA34_02365 [Desulfobulbus propionicus]
MRTLFLLLLAIFSGTLPCQANDVYVDGTYGQDNPTCGLSPDQPCKTVKHVLHTFYFTPLNIKMAVGTYSENISLNDVSPQDLTLEGGWNQNFTAQQCDPDLTVLEQPDNEEYVLYTYREKAKQYNLRLSCLTLREDPAAGDWLPLVKVEVDEQAKLTFTMNRCVVDERVGSGVCLTTRGDATMHATMANTIFRNAHSTEPGPFGGGVLASSRDSSKLTLTMKNCLLHNNTVYNGAGIYVDSGNTSLLTADLTNVTVTNNHAEGYGGGLSATSIDTSTLTINLTNAIIHSNSADSAGNDLRLIGQPGGSTNTTNVRYSIIGEVVNHGATWNDNGHNLEVNPHLNSSYHLRSGSPAIDAGICGELDWVLYTRIAPYFDIDGDPRPPFPALTGCDIGADEYVREDEDSLCFPVKAKNGTTTIICL